MRLLEIELENFKSFKGRISIPFGDGFTSITGPNGSGKSNITDAIIFMMVPRTNALRAKRLNYLVYGHNPENPKTKGLAGFCKVKMVFENSDRFLAIDSDIVEFTRGIKIKGEDYSTFYRLNGRASTAGEFEKLFSRAGLYANGYNVIQQGNVLQTSLMSGAERRRKVEDVAGITAYDTRLRRTKSAREAVEADTVLLSERQKECGRLLKQLEKEKRDAERLEEIQESLAEIEILLKFRIVMDLETDIGQRQDLVNQYSEEIEKLAGELRDLEGKIKETENELENVEENINEAGGEAARELQRKLDAVRVESALAKSNSEHAGEMLRKLEEERKNMLEEIQENDAEFKNIEKDWKDLESGCKINQKELKKYTEMLGDLEDSIADSSQSVGKKRESLEEIRKNESELKIKINRLEVEKEQIERQIEESDELVIGAENVLKSVKEDVDEVIFSLEDLKVGKKSANDNLNKIKTKEEKVRNRLDEVRNCLVNTEDKSRKLSVEYASLVAVEKTREEFQNGYVNAVKEILEARDSGELGGIIGTVAELGKVDEEFNDALRVAAGMNLQSVVTENDDAASRAIDFLKNRKLGRVRFLPINKLRNYKPGANSILISRQEGAIGFAIDLVDFDERYRDAFGNVFGDTIIMKNLKDAKNYLGKGRMVTLEGELLEKGGALIGGTVSKTSVSFGGGDRKKVDDLRIEIDRLEKEYREFDSERDGLENEIAELSEARISIENAFASIQTRVTDYDGQTTKAQNELVKAEQDVKTKQDSVEILRKSLLEKEGVLLSVKEEFEKCNQKVSDEEKELAMLAGGATADKMNELKEKIEIERTEFGEKSNNLSGMKVKLENYRTGLKIIKEDIENNEQEQKKQQKILTVDSKKSRELEKEVAILKEREETEFDKLQGLRTERDRLRDNLSNYKSKTEQRSEFGRARERAIDDLQLEITTKEEKLKEARKKLPTKVEKPEKIPVNDQLVSKKESLEKQKGALGYVNMLSLRHYREEEERFEEIKKRMKELRADVRRLESLENKISKRKDKKFMGVFEDINKNFQKTFKELVGGGKAWLELEKPENIFKGGIQVKARMPGKRLFPVELLSGGEKSMVAMAFIFAIQRYEPCPFYLLDEPDQNTDGVNTENIGKAIALQSKVAQFIVVTLHHMALRESDHVIGVFMNNGVSNIRQIPDVENFLSTLPAEVEV